MKFTKFLLILPLIAPLTLLGHTFKFVDNKTNSSLDKNFIKNLVDVFKPDIFFETGTYDAKTTINAAPFFREIHTVELHNGMYNKAKELLNQYKHITAHHGSSPEIFSSVLPHLNGTILFWLDAHYSGEGTALSFDDPSNAQAITAIRGELEAIKNFNTNECIILIDDIRGFGTTINDQEFLGCWAYPTIQEVQKQLFSINPNFEILLLGDTLLAYDKTKYSPSFSATVIACTKTRLFDGNNLSDSALIELEQTIMNAPADEKKFISYLYNQMTNWKDPMPWHDLWYGLVSLGSKNHREATIAFNKVKTRTQHFDSNRQVVDKIIEYNHPHINMYLALSK